MQVDEEPPIRANTTILLGNLADHLSEATQKRVLLNAFTRALKDLFPPARVAGLRVRTVGLSSVVQAAIAIRRAERNPPHTWPSDELFAVSWGCI